MGNYIKVCPFIAEQLGVADIRQRTADGNYLLWQQDVAAIQGETLEERSKYVGGAVIGARQSKEELKGTAEPVPLIEGSEDDLPEDLSGEQETGPQGEAETSAEDLQESIDNPGEELHETTEQETNETEERRNRK